MNSEEEVIVSLLEAKKLKSDGFINPTYHFYLDKNLPFVDKGLKRVKIGQRRMNHNKYEEYIYSAPTKREMSNWIKRQKNEQ